MTERSESALSLQASPERRSFGALSGGEIGPEMSVIHGSGPVGVTVRVPVSVNGGPSSNAFQPLAFPLLMSLELLSLILLMLLQFFLPVIVMLGLGGSGQRQGAGHPSGE